MGPARAADLEKLGLYTVEDLLYHFPRRYEDMRLRKPIREVTPGERVAVVGRVERVTERLARRRWGLVVTHALISDGTGRLGLLFFTQSRRLPTHITRQLRLGTEIEAFGEASLEGDLLVIKNPVFAPAGRDSLHLGRLVPVHPLAGELTARFMRGLIDQALAEYGSALEVPLPFPANFPVKPLSKAEALRGIHFPADWEEVEEARRRLAWEELFFLELALEWGRSALKQQGQGHLCTRDGPLVRSFLRCLPFTLTASQKEALAQVAADLESGRPMRRLLQGDVGSGKTVVAAYALLKAVENGLQGALMAPTAVLAEQHLETLNRFWHGLGVSVALLTGDLPREELARLRQEVAAGRIQVAVGTQALIQAETSFARLGMVVVDEQHRFGVLQRTALSAKGDNPHVLIMSATPIPRTLALCLYGDLDVTVLKELPPGRQPIKTRWLAPDQRPRVYQFLRRQLAAGHQAYLICPRIEAEEGGAGAVERAKELAASEFRGFRVGLLHGRLLPQEQDRVLRAFRRGEVQLLVSTTVVETGIDVPQASVVVVEEADRFGLAQLHQLRGRVGRGVAPAWCLLLADPRTPEARRRLEILVETGDGFRIAEEDLRLRGPGEFFGLRQHGLPELGLRAADLLRDVDLLAAAQQEARRILAHDPTLREPPAPLWRAELASRYPRLLPELV